MRGALWVLIPLAEASGIASQSVAEMKLSEPNGDLVMLMVAALFAMPIVCKSDASVDSSCLHDDQASVFRHIVHAP